MANATNNVTESATIEVTPATESAPTPGTLLLLSLENRVSVGQIPVELRKTVKDVNPKAKTPGGKYTPSDKAVLGIAEENIITWAPANFPYSVSEQLKLIAKKLDMRADELLASVIMTWVRDNQEAITEIAGEVVYTEKSEEELEKEIARLMRKMENAQAVIAARKKS